jgi:hypothetical protein
MQYKLLLAGVFMFFTSTLNDPFQLLKEPSENISLHIKKPAAPFWELGKKNDLATDTASLKQSNWYGEAIKNITASEYHFEWEEKLNAYCTPNRKNNLRFFYDENGFSVEPRTTQIPIGEYDPMKRPDEIKYKQLPGWKINFNLDKSQVGKGIWRVADNKAEYVTDNITVQYINNEEGMRQNFIVQKPISKKDELKINFSIKTKLKISLQGDQMKFFYKKTGNVLNYADLKVWDADQKILEAGFVKKGEGDYAIEVNTADAVYPITIDPLSTGTAGTPDWIGDDADQANAWFGYSVASAGDVNGDGYSDVIIGAYAYDDGANTNEGRAFVYHGSATGLSATPNSTPDDADQVSAWFGYSVASAGDVNGDGYSDVIIGAYAYDDGANTDEGRAFVYHGSAAGLSATPNNTPDDANQAGAYFGLSAASAGDVNGDGYSDVIIGASLYDDGANTDEGRAFVYHGSAAGLSATPNSTPDDADQALAYFGTSVAGAGDVNGDGYSDVIIGAYFFDDGANTDEGRAFVYHGSAAGLSATPNSTPDDADQASAYFGTSVAGAGDVNGDGYSDVIIGAYFFDDGANTDEGRAFVYHGSAAGLSATPNSTPDDADQASAYFGTSVAGAGDVNGDGYSDVIIGAYFFDDGANTDEGRAFVYHGSAAGLSATPNSTPDDANQANARFGISVASAGDVNGDGYSDVIIGAALFDDGANEGRAFVYHGSATGINTTATATLESNQANAQFGYSVASTGDVNGDGYSDAIVGAPYYDNGQSDEGAAFVFHGSAIGINTTAAATVESNQVSAYMGISVASAGDVNGDGYSDVIVGADFYSNGQAEEGAAFVYHGSATGISTIAAAIVESNQANAYMGWSVASAGDVNGDGYSDVIVGVTDYNNGQASEGGAFMYHGSATGISTTVAAIVESNQAFASMGWSVASGGDVNGDGYSDVIVGALNFDNGQTNEGAAFVYHGSSTGISTTAAVMVESNQANAFMGRSVAPAGDVNGDGYSDVIVGANRYDNGQTDEGAAFGYYGSATGINTAVAFFLESDRAGAIFGWSVASAGDANGDGYSDVIIGSPAYSNGQTDEGVAFVYYGSATGIIGASMVESNQVGAQLGWSVASAGDVNGDGYSDVMAGAITYDNGQAYEGAAFVYMGNSPGTNKRNNLRLYNTNLVTPISHFNITEPNLFGAGLFAKSPLGRVKGKLVWEVKAQGVAFSGNPITNSTGYLGKQPSFTNLGIAGTELKYNVQKVGSKNNKIRTRVEYDKVTAITGQVYGPWRYPAGYTMGAYGMNSIPLPITLISFNGQFINVDDVQMNWITSNEMNMQSYFVERSTDGMNFTAIGELAAKGIGSNRADYSFTDKNVKHNLLYYRLKLKEKSGDESYTKTITLSRSKTVKNFIAPNPVMAGNDVLLTLQSVTDKNLVSIQIYNLQGQLIGTENKTLQNGRNEITLSTNRLTTGIYVVNVLGDGVKESYKLVVQ